MKRLFAILTCILLLNIFDADGARYYYFKHLNATDGLPSNTIYCSLQDQAGFMWIGTRDGLCRYDGKEFVRLGEIIPELHNSGTVNHIEEDDNGKIWFSSMNGVFYYDPATDSYGSLGLSGRNSCNDIKADRKGNVWFAANSLFRYDTANSGIHTYSIGGSQPMMLTVDSLGTIWVLLQDGDLYTYDRLNDTFRHQHLQHKTKIIEAVSGGKLLAATYDNEVLLLDCISLNGKQIFDNRDKKEIRCLKESSESEFWIGTDSGLYIRRNGVDYQGEAFHDASTPGSLSENFITSIDKDRSGNLWIGTYYTGINIWKGSNEDMAIYFSNPSANSSKGKIVRSICSDQAGRIWFCTEDGYLNRLDTHSYEMRHFEIEPGMNMQGLIIDGSTLWICSYSHGLYRMNMDTEKAVRHTGYPEERAICGYMTKEGQLYIGSSKGVYRSDSSKTGFSKIESVGDEYINCIRQDISGILWVGTLGNGIFCLDKNGNLLAHAGSEKSGQGLTSRFITSFHEDSRHRMWVTTEGGGVCYTQPGYHLEKLQFNRIEVKDGLPSNITSSIAEDIDGTFWVSTSNGIAIISGNTLNVNGMINYNNEVTGYQYSYGAVHTTPNGTIYFGNTDGMISITPAKMKRSAESYPISITAIEARNSDKTTKLNKPGTSAIATEYVTVRHKDASAISISFVAPEYRAQDLVYRYTIYKGRNKAFSGTTDENHVMMTALGPGKYRFEVGIEGQENLQAYNRSLRIRIKPHPLMSITAQCIYAALCLGLVALIIFLIDYRRKRMREIQIAKLEDKKEKDIYTAKINYFTNITHEIRTPLTLIKMPLDKIIAQGEYTPASEKDLKTIQANADRLLNLTNQLLDMRKMEQNRIQLDLMREDICAIARKSAKYFEQMAADQHMELNLEIPEKPIYVPCAKDSIVTIVSNLLSNAVKYGKNVINLSVRTSEDNEKLFIRVDSNGDLIPVSDKEKIFNIFFQREESKINGRISQGTGLGLPYARALANMHNGKLYLDKNVTDVNSFVLELPVRQEETVLKGQNPPPSEKASREKADYDSSRHTILIAEDSEEMREYLVEELADTYNVFAAANGSDALEIARREKIDLVISDIMMPIMDGCELCNRIKSDSDLSHVPVILLTAVVGVEKRIETLESGADGYIEKPFPIELLRSNISNLFKNKEIAYKQFISKPLTHYNSVTASKVDEEYMDKLHEFIMKHISEPDLNIESLTLQLGTSKSSLYRKLKANTGLSINEYIRLCRLKQAAELLSSQKYKINEVAFMTGFSSPSYFATCFQKQFNITPSDFVRNLGQ